MERSASRKFLGLILAVILTLPCCRHAENLNNKESNSMFRLLKPERSGIGFANRLQETDSANAIFYEYYYNGSGLAAGDLNNDGLTDLVFGANMSKCRVYLNKSNLTFTDITDKLGINTAGKWITGVSIVDINQDGWPDIYLCAAGNINYDYHNLLYISNGKKDSLSFRECASLTGLNDNGYSTQAEFFDYDGDGDLDAYIVTAAMTIPNKNAIRQRKKDGSMLNTDRLYRNEGINPSTGLPLFRNVSQEAGITYDGFGLGACVCDINKDGWPDIYVGNDYISNDLLYINMGNGTFKEMVSEYTRHISNSTMGVDIADFNNDGFADIISLDMQPENYLRKRTMAMTMRDYHRYLNELDAGYSPQYIRNMLQMNNGPVEGRILFSEIGQLSGIFETDWSWAPLFADFDNDGMKDLFIGNGIPGDVTNMDMSELWTKTVREKPGIQFSVLYKMLKSEMNKLGDIKKPNVMFRNERGMDFKKVTAEWGLDQPGYSTGSIYADLDNDGDLDIVLNKLNDNACIYENRIITSDSVPQKDHYLTVRLKGTAPNLEGTGSKVTVYYGREMQYNEQFPIRGFQSMVDPVMHFGLGDKTIVDSLEIIWPDRKRQLLTFIKCDHTLTLDQKDASQSVIHKTEKSDLMFTKYTGKYNIIYKHRERQFIDFDIQPLVPHLFSKEGPGIAIGDINSDGLDDFYIGGSTGFSGQVFIQGKEGSFTGYPLPGHNNFEDMGALLFDADGDGDNDLYVVSGGSGLPPGNVFYSDRLYINDGHGNFTYNRSALPDERVCGSQVTAADFDRDGDLDLFVCGRVNLENYPIPPRSFLLRNDSNRSQVKFTDITQNSAPGLSNPGLLASAIWSDFNDDGWQDLVIAGEWMPVSFFRNEKGKLVDITSTTGVENYTGWWNSLASVDLDMDGDMDYIAGNLGLNTQYKVSQEEPMRIFAKDFDRNGTLDPVCSYYVQGKSYPIYHRNLLLSQIPSLKNRFKTYGSYARATFDNIFSQEEQKDAYKKDARYLMSSWFENKGNGIFSVHALPEEAQISPVFGILSGDYNNDGCPDILISGNSYASNVYTGQYDASIGLLLTGDGKGGLGPVPGRTSGFIADGDTKAMFEISLKDGSSLILVARNNDTLKVIRPLKENKTWRRIRNDEASALFEFANGKKENVEFCYGSGYLSQSSKVCRIPHGAVSVTFRTYNGEKRKVGLQK